MSVLRLRDLGERRILSEIVSDFASSIGDDCAVVDFLDRRLVVSTDPVPAPAARVIGNDSDPYWMGWLSVTINASDLAAAGAQPLAFLAAIELPDDYPVGDFRRLLAGIRDSCAAENLNYIGGNLKEGPRDSIVGTVVGHCESSPLTRAGASPGNRIMSIGQGGRFWRDAMAVRADPSAVDKQRSPLFAPTSQIGPCAVLAAAGLIKAAIDNSDGTLPSLEQLAISSGVQVVLNLPSLGADQSASESQISERRAWLGWGDWNVFIVVEEGTVGRVRAQCAALGVAATDIGWVESGEAGLHLVGDSERVRAPRLESERFSQDSWFSDGIDGYIERLLSVPLPS